MAEKLPKKTMPYVRLGNSGLKVSKIILGTMQYGRSEWQKWVSDDEDMAIEHIKTAYEAGIQTFDTADVYSNGVAEIILGKAIKKLNLPRDEIVVMTKCYFPIAKDMSVMTVPIDPEADKLGFVNQHHLSRKHIFSAIKQSLERLQLDYVDVYQCHRFDKETPIEETMQALHDVVKAGYARYIGMSSCYAYQFHAMQSYAINNRLTPFISMQNHYSLIYREEEREMMPTLKMFGVGSIPWSPLGRGLLTRPVDEKTTRGDSDWSITRYEDQMTTDIVNRVEEISKKKGISMAQVAIAWCLSKPGVTAPIVGTSKLDNLHDILGGIHVELTDEEIKFLEEPYKPRAVIGHV